MRYFLIIPTVTAALAGAAFASLHAMGRPTHLNAMLVAAAICTGGALIGLLPALFQRTANQSVVAMAALVGTVIHLLLSIVLAGAVSLAHLISDGTPFLFWMLMFYWVTLMALGIAVVRILRQAPRVTGLTMSPPADRSTSGVRAAGNHVGNQ